MNHGADDLGAHPAPGQAIEVPQSITCVDCGGRCGLLTTPEVDHDGHPIPFRAGDVVAYRCSDCLDRWDIVLE